MSFYFCLEFSTGELICTETPKPESLFMVCYTSGSTGIPKGVKITHQCVVKTIQSLFQRLEGDIFNNTASHLSYLPLAHIMEQMISLSTLLVGARIGFLTKNIQGLLADLQAVKPHFFFTVPRVLSRLYSVAMEKVSSVPLLPSIFNYAVESKVAEQEKNIYDNSSIWDFIFFNKIRQTLGGRVKVIVSGSAPVANEILRFTRGVFGCPVIVGYGFSESCGVISLTLFGDKSLGHVGALIPGISAKLVDVPYMGISVEKMKMGEVCVKGLNCTQGYYGDEESTRQLIDKDGWLHTGDIGTWTKEGSLKIVDRCKNIFKLSQGEYIAPERLENIYQLSPLVEQIFVDGNSFYDFPIAVVVPNIKELTKRILSKANFNDSLLLNSNKEETEASKYKLDDSNPIVDTPTLCSQPAARKIVVSELENLGKKRGLKGFEIIKRVYLSSIPFTVENGLVTSNFKLARSRLRETFSDRLREYIAPERLENIYQLSPLVEQIFVDGNSFYDFPIAVVVPNIKELTKRILSKANFNDSLLLNSNKEETEASKYKLDDSNPIVDTPTLCSQPAARKIVVSELENLGKKRGLKGFEIIKRVYLSSIPFTVENGLVTSNFKLARSRLRETFSDRLRLLYEEASA
ncbi:unnamed protein product [Schistosoma rodhaini]|uniref:long-chain-fatty-acid--CoA ligase n=1 Tax=Schistosoma rodhaini TaxID=6188 RepID=A0AA85GK00_9TREM|nr:unnamed protein product [Schistosoma rodhaini]